MPDPRNMDDIERLEEFAATKDFTWENIIFLKRVGSWKEKWRSPEVNPGNGEMPPPVLKALYNAAEEIFQPLVHRQTSDFPLNLEDDIYLTLDQVFGGNSNHGLRRSSSTDRFNTFPEAMIAPFADDFAANASRLPDRKGFREIRKKDSEAGAGVVTVETNLDHSSSQLPWIPEGLEKVFDDAEVAVKQMVLTNTWIRYVDSLPVTDRLFIGVTSQISSPHCQGTGHYNTGTMQHCSRIPTLFMHIFVGSLNANNNPPSNPSASKSEKKGKKKEKEIISQAKAGKIRDIL
ncbi:hypothetical protein HOY80DRAFT_1023797 [Tuber brumale]|nr:hypothetical protein HOY80DRAFT_1023797 [Tuber brumale]